MTDAQFLQAFQQCSLPATQWTHTAHVRMAWLYLRQLPLAEALPRVREGIQRYNVSLNKPSGYHETITQGFLVLIDHRLQGENRVQTFDEFCTKHPDILDRTLSALLIHYKKETLYSANARATFVEPDLAPFPSKPMQTNGIN